MFAFLLDQNLVLHSEQAGARWHHLFRETYTTMDGVTHDNTALSCGAAGSRFSDPRTPAEFRVWYGAADFRSAFLETVVRDTGEGKAGLIPIARSEIFERRWSEIEILADLRLIDLSDDGCTRMRIDTDTVGARSHASGRQLSVILHGHGSAPDGIRFRSRLTGALNIAVYDRAFAKLKVAAEGRLVDHAELPALIAQHQLRIKRAAQVRRRARQRQPGRVN
jgi:hypothetical protein